MEPKIELIGLKGIPLVKAGDNIPKIILDALIKNNLTLREGDILVIAQTIISKSQDRIVNLKKIKPSKLALDIYKRLTPKAKIEGIPIKSPELIQAILDESREVLKIEHVLITETHHGFICANAGIDKSNIEGIDNVALLPKYPDEIATIIRSELKKSTDIDVAVIISDSFGRSFRVGAVGTAIGVSGINPLLDKRGSKDLFNQELKSTIIAQVDSLASAAQLVMGEADEGIPIILIRGYQFEFNENANLKAILREKDKDLFRGNLYDDFKKILKNRRSYKFEFNKRDVDINLIKKSIKMARWAPSAHNGQFWRYIIIENYELRKNLIYAMNQKLREDLESDGKDYSFINNKIKRTRRSFLNSPYLLLLCLDKEDLDKYPDKERNLNEYILGIQSISASATYLLIAFELNGLSACWYSAPLFSKDLVKNVLNLPETFIPMSFFTVGYPTKICKSPARKILDEILYFSKDFKSKDYE